MMKTTELKIIKCQKQNIKFYQQNKISQTKYAISYLASFQNHTQKLLIKIAKNHPHFTFSNSHPLITYQHSHLLKYYTFDPISNPNILTITLYCNMGNLKSIIHSHQIQNKPFKIYQINQIMNDILSGYNQIAKIGFYHSNLKPNNILIHNNVFKIGDLEYCQKLGKEADNLSKNLDYMSIQKMKSKKQKIDYRSQNIYSLGIILFEMVYLCHPFINQYFQQYCKIKKGEYKYQKEDKEIYYNAEFLEQSKILKPNKYQFLYDFTLFNIIDRMISHNPNNRPKLDQITQFFKLRITMRQSYNIKEAIINLEDSILENISDAARMIQYKLQKKQIIKIENIISFIAKRRYFTCTLDLLINPISKEFSNIKKLQSYIDYLIKKIVIVNLEFSKQTKFIVNKMIQCLSQIQTQNLKSSQYKPYFKLLEYDLQQFQKIYEKQFKDNQSKMQYFNIELQLTKIAQTSKKILEQLKHINEYKQDTLKNIEYLLTLYDIHSLKSRILQMKEDQIYRIQMHTLSRKQIIRKFIDYEISENLYYSQD